MGGSVTAIGCWMAVEPSARTTVAVRSEAHGSPACPGRHSHTVPAASGPASTPGVDVVDDDAGDADAGVVDDGDDVGAAADGPDDPLHADRVMTHRATTSNGGLTRCHDVMSPAGRAPPGGCRSPVQPGRPSPLEPATARPPPAGRVPGPVAHGPRRCGPSGPIRSSVPTPHRRRRWRPPVR